MSVLLDLEYMTQREKLYQSTVDFERVESLLDVGTGDTLKSETRMTASVLKQDPNTHKKRSKICRSCVCIIINKTSFEPFMCLDLVVPYPQIDTFGRRHFTEVELLTVL